MILVTVYMYYQIVNHHTENLKLRLVYIEKRTLIMSLYNIIQVHVYNRLFNNVSTYTYKLQLLLV